MKKKIIFISLFTLMLGTTAMAANKWTAVFSHKNMNAQGALETTWKAGNAYDYGKAATSFQNGKHNGHKVTTYLESVKGGKVQETRFTHDYFNAVTPQISLVGASRFGSAHAIASASNVHSSLTARHLTD